MKRLAVMILALTLALSALPALAKAETKIGYVDLQRALNDSLAGKEAKTELESQMKVMQAEIDKRIAKRDKLKGDLEKQSSALSLDARRQKADQLEKMEKEVDRLISDANTEMQKRQRDKEMAILKEIKVVIDDIGKKDGYTMIVPSDVVLYSKDGTDLTQAVIDLYNAQRTAPAAPAKKPKK